MGYRLWRVLALTPRWICKIINPKIKLCDKRYIIAIFYPPPSLHLVEMEVVVTQNVNCMNEERKVIFYGNGLNQISKGLNWQELLDCITTDNNSIPNIDSNTMRYELIYLSKEIKPVTDGMPSQETTEFELKKRITSVS